MGGSGGGGKGYHVYFADHQIEISHTHAYLLNHLLNRKFPILQVVAPKGLGISQTPHWTCPNSFSRGRISI